MWFSQHGIGEAYTFDCIEKHGRAPVAYAALGSHALYATSGRKDRSVQNYNLPRLAVKDECQAGTFWDPVASCYFYKYKSAVRSRSLCHRFVPYNGVDPTSFLYFKGKWGDDEPSQDGRNDQDGVLSLKKYIGGSLGPVMHQLDRIAVNPDRKGCTIRTALPKADFYYGCEGQRLAASPKLEPSAFEASRKKRRRGVRTDGLPADLSLFEMDESEEESKTEVESSSDESSSDETLLNDGD